MTLIEWGNEGISLRLCVDEGRVTLVNLGPTGHLGPDVPVHIALNPVELQLAGDQLPQGSRHVELGGTDRLRYSSHETAPNRLTLVQHDDVRALRVESRWSIDAGLPVVRAVTTVTNLSKEAVTLEYLSSFVYNGFARFSDRQWEHSTTVAIAHNTFFGEFQWVEHPLPELGVYDVGFLPEGVHSSKKRIAATSVGTQPSTEFLPMGAIRDAARGVSWGWQIEHNGSWHWEVGDHRTAIYLAAGGPNDQEHQWSAVLRPGQSFESVPIAVVSVAGAVEDMFAPLTEYRRGIRRPNDDNVSLPIVFNDYMNSILAEPTEEKLFPVIASAAVAGSEYYCVDAGWYSDEPGWWNSVGEWRESSVRFPRGFGVVFDEIRSKGMIPGLWIEPEVIGIESPVARELPDSAFFAHNGARVNSAGRHQLDFRSHAVTERMDAVIDRLIADYGLGYMKFDYNINGGIGTDLDSDSAGDGLLGHNRAYLAWLDAVIARHPAVVFEACASGGGRIDYATLARHSILSTSDQTDHVLTAAIAAGAHTAVTPEQAAVWVYPQPEFSDDELHLTIINGMLARPQLSGGMWKLSDAQLEVVAGAMRVYRGYRERIPLSLPFWPLGLPGWSDDWIAHGLADGDDLYLAVWRRGGPDSIELSLPFAVSAVEQLFPALPKLASISGASLLVTLPASPSARLYRLRR